MSDLVCGYCARVGTNDTQGPSSHSPGCHKGISLMSRSYHYSNPEVEKNPTSLPNIETWRSRIYEISCECGEYEVSEEYAQAPEPLCPSCNTTKVAVNATDDFGWFYWFCFPGCLPDGEENGPFESQEEALKEARDE